MPVQLQCPTCRRVADIEALAPTQNLWTVILLYPDYAATSYGQDTWFDTVEAKNPVQALARARRYVVLHHGGIGNPHDLLPIAVIRGDHQDENPER